MKFLKIVVCANDPGSCNTEIRSSTAVQLFKKHRVMTSSLIQNKPSTASIS